MQTFTEQFYINEETFAFVSQILLPVKQSLFRCHFIKGCEWKCSTLS